MEPVHGMVAVRAPKRRRRRWTVVFVGAALSGVVGAAFDFPLLLAGGWLAMMAATLGVATAEGDPGAQEGVMGTLRIDADHLVLSGPGRTEMWSREEVVDGYAVPSASGDALVLCTADGREIHMPDPSRAAGEVLAELGLDRRAVRMSLVADPRAARGCVGLVVAPLAAWIGMSAAMGVGGLLASLWAGPTTALLGVIVFLGGLTFSPLVWGLAHFLVPHRVVIGREGVLLRRFLRPDRFISHADLERASSSPAHLDLRVNGTLLQVRASDGAAATAATLIAARRREYEAQVPRDAVLAVVRGGEDWATWRDRLGELVGRPQAGFRRGVIDHETLVHMVEDPTGAPELRVGAAYALARGSQGDDPRLRVAVEDCAEPRLRVALERALEGELEQAALEEAEAVLRGSAGAS